MSESNIQFGVKDTLEGIIEDIEEVEEHNTLLTSYSSMKLSDSSSNQSVVDSNTSSITSCTAPITLQGDSSAPKVTRVLKQWEIRANEESARRKEEYERKNTRYTIHGNPVVLSDAQIGLLNSGCNKRTQQQVIDMAYEIQQGNQRVLERESQAKLAASAPITTIAPIERSDPQSTRVIVEDSGRRKTKVLDAAKQRELMTGTTLEVRSSVAPKITLRLKSADTNTAIRTN
jgi:hypothetical protein